ncbi:MAG TPA: protein phosphatase CheZ [Burkholderiales bacterium]|nr:protein phosphatase CheZ [Burkholderiales bacterium]
MGATNDNEELQAIFDAVAKEAAAAQPGRGPAPAAAPAETSSGPAADRMLAGIGNLTRALHDHLRELGFDRALEEAASAIPDARDRLTYVATMTEQAAQRTLTATELAKPIQDGMAAEASALSEQWARLLARQMDVSGFRDLVQKTIGYLGNVPQNVNVTKTQLHEIMMAQDFQDLTGQVIKKITDLIQFIEQQLLQLLLENTPPQRRSQQANSLMNGPVISSQGLVDVVTTQEQVDDLLESLGF